MFANPMMEQLPRERLEDFQAKLLLKQLRWAEEKSRYYKESFQKQGVRASDFHTLADLRKFPFTDHAALCKAGLYDRITLPLSQMTSYALEEQADTAVETVRTQGDGMHGIEIASRALAAAGVTSASVVGILGDLSDVRLMDFVHAAQALGALAVPLGGLFPHWRQITCRMPLDTLIGYGEHVMQLVVRQQAGETDITELGIKRILYLNAASIQNAMQKHVRERTKAEIYPLYAPAEIGAAGMLYPCPAHKGKHVAEDYFYPEVLAFGEDAPPPEGSMGELVVTALQAEALPLIRYRTGQAVQFAGEPCACGRTHRRVLTPLSAL